MKIRFLILLFLLLTACDFEANAGAELFESELALFDKAIETKVADGVYFIKALDGFLPLLNRYVLITCEDERFEFNSIEVLGYKNGGYGYIRTGVLNKEETVYDKFLEGSQRKYNVTEEKMYGLNIYIVSISAESEEVENFQQVIIVDKNRYVTITDKNTDLWKKMLEVYSLVNQK